MVSGSIPGTKTAKVNLSKAPNLDVSQPNPGTGVEFELINSNFPQPLTWRRPAGSGSAGV